MKTNVLRRSLIALSTQYTCARACVRSHVPQAAAVLLKASIVVTEQPMQGSRDTCAAVGEDEHLAALPDRAQARSTPAAREAAGRQISRSVHPERATLLMQVGRTASLPDMANRSAQAEQSCPQRCSTRHRAGRALWQPSALRHIFAYSPARLERHLPGGLTMHGQLTRLCPARLLLAKSTVH